MSPVRPAIIVVALVTTAVWLSRSQRTTPNADRQVPRSIGRPTAAAFAAGRDRAVELDPRAACERAASVGDASRRFDTVRTELLAWSNTDPAAALAWANDCTDDLRSAALAVIADALSAQPQRAVDIGGQWMRQHPESADEVGSLLIGALVRRAAFTASLQLVGAGPAKSCEPWCCVIFDAWAQRDPASARDLADALRRQDVLGPVFAALARGWAQSAPEELVAYGATLPTGSDRTAALHAGLDQWLLRDPSAAGAWIRQLTDPHERDAALAAYLTRTDQVERSTPDAVALAEQIADPALHFTALEHVMRELAADHQLDAARRYIATAVGLDAQQRRQLVADLGPMSASDPAGYSRGF